MTSPITKSRLAIFAVSTLLALASPITATSAHAYDDDVEFVCGDNDDGSTWCVSVDDLKAECPVVDPEYTTELCQGLLESRRPASLDHFFDNEQPDRPIARRTTLPTEAEACIGGPDC